MTVFAIIIVCYPKQYFLAMVAHGRNWMLVFLHSSSVALMLFC